MYDFIRVNHEIINPQKHLPHATILQSSKYVEKFSQKDDLIKYLLNDKSKYRIFDTIGPQNKWAAFNIDNVRGYHPAKLKIYDNLIKELNIKGYQIWPPNILKLLNVKYLILPFNSFP